ncbi:alkaline ceramidase 3 [Cyprinus carpio]|uniref:Alkaline ceramidase n=1 Tax=Cyprinus carpio TaxID=7962 RepID=A0A9R0A756_CYPCA|nr:alkaline ceramidase 3 [Cyprinus carpio]
MSSWVGGGGYWGTPTSTLDWCEENYVVSYYIAEFCKYVRTSGLCSVHAVHCRVGRLGIAAVGIGSWSFHMTLQYEMQLLDELPMIYSCCVFVYCLYECFKQERVVNHLSVTFLLTFSIIVSVVYLIWKEPVFHQLVLSLKVYNFLIISPSVLVAFLVIRSVFIVTWVYPWLRALGFTSLSVFLLGFVLWNIDNIFCDSLRATRQRLPPVVGAVTQLHAWWHILTGLGSYLHILLSLQIRSTYLKHRPKVKFLCGVWPMLHIESQKAS